MEGPQDNTAIEKLVLGFINESGQIENTELFAQQQNISKEVLEAVVKSLSADEYIVNSVIERKEIELTEEGRGYAQNGSPEF